MLPIRALLTIRRSWMIPVNQDPRMKWTNLSDFSFRLRLLTSLLVCRPAHIDGILLFILEVHGSIHFSRWLSSLDLNICARVAHAGVFHRLARAALLVTHPLEEWRPSFLCLQLGQRSKQYTNGMSATDGILRTFKVIGEVMMSVASVSRRHRQELHSFLVQCANGFVDRMFRKICWRSIRTT